MKNRSAILISEKTTSAGERSGIFHVLHLTAPNDPAEAEAGLCLARDLGTFTADEVLAGICISIDDGEPVEATIAH